MRKSFPGLLDWELDFFVVMELLVKSDFKKCFSVFLRSESETYYEFCTKIADQEIVDVRFTQTARVS